MTQKFLLPRPQQVTAAGVPIVGSVGFYITTTSTLMAVYADRALTTPLANPVNADSNGRLPAVWFQNADVFAGIKVVSYSAPDGGGSVLWSLDPYEDNTTAADLNAAQLSGGNAFTGDQSFANAATFLGPTTLESTDAGATAGPTLELYRNSASPAAADDLGKIDFQGEDSAGNLENYARIKAVAVDPTSTAEDGKLAVHTVVAGTLAERMAVGAGVTVGSPTGGDPGAGWLNAAGLKINNAEVKVVTATGSPPIYGCRAFGCFNGSGTPAWRISGNMDATITDVGAGIWDVAFTVPMPTADYAIVPGVNLGAPGTDYRTINFMNQTASGFRISCMRNNSFGIFTPALYDAEYISFAVFC